MIKNGYEKVYEVETVTWNNEDEDFEDEKSVRGLSGVAAMKMIADYLVQHPNAKDGNIATEPEDGMFISMREIDQDGNEYWISAYCTDKEP